MRCNRATGNVGFDIRLDGGGRLIFSVLVLNRTRVLVLNRTRTQAPAGTRTRARTRMGQ
jgi:hypothetical protein